MKGTIHWVSAQHAHKAEVRLYDHLFQVENPAKEEDWEASINPGSFEKISEACLEPSLKDALPGSRYQFERTGYFCVDTKDSTPGNPVFNRTVSLRDAWAKMAKKGGK